MRIVGTEKNKHRTYQTEPHSPGVCIGPTDSMLTLGGIIKNPEDPGESKTRPEHQKASQAARYGLICFSWQAGVCVKPTPCTIPSVSEIWDLDYVLFIHQKKRHPTYCYNVLTFKNKGLKKNKHCNRTVKTWFMVYGTALLRPSLLKQTNIEHVGTSLNSNSNKDPFYSNLEGLSTQALFVRLS